MACFCQLIRIVLGLCQIIKYRDNAGFIKGYIVVNDVMLFYYVLEQNIFAAQREFCVSEIMMQVSQKCY